MTNNRKKGIRTAGALFIILLCALGYWTYRCLNPTREQVQAAKARIEAYSCYEIRRNGKTMLRFDEDTTTLAATFMNRWALVPSCQGRLAASNNTDITRNRYQGLDADSVLVEKVDSLDSLYKDSKWKESELAYYIHSHSVMDLGYNRICAFENREKVLRDSAKKMLDSLHHIQGKTPSDKTDQKDGKLVLVHLIKYKAFYTDENGKPRSEDCKLIQTNADERKDRQYCHLFQLVSETTPDGIYGIAPRTAIGIVKLQGATHRDTINYEQRHDSLGYFSGSYDSLYQAEGYGTWMGHDGSYYEGEWKNGERNGWGFSIAPKKPLRVGEWKKTNTRESDWYIPHSESMVSISRNISTSKAESDIR